MKNVVLLVSLLSLLTLSACGGSSDERQGGSRSGARPGSMGGGMGGSQPSASVPVQVEAVSRRSISQYLETNGTLEAENEVDIVARTSGPVTKILAEEGQMIRSGHLIARIDERESSNQVAIATVARDDAQLAFDRSKKSWDEGLVSRETYDSARSQLNSTTAQLESAQIQLAYTEIRAPFDGLVVTRNVKLAQYVTSGTTLFRISDFTLLLCRVEVPEKDLPRITTGQTAHLRFEAYPEDRFEASVARMRPTVDAATGTFTVTLEVDGRGKLRPGMFASVFLQTETRDDVLVIPRGTLVVDSLGDTVFVKSGDIAERREVGLGIRDEDSIEIRSGLSEGDLLIVIGQDGLADGTPVAVLGEQATAPAAQASTESGSGPPPEAIEAMKKRMKDRGMSEEQIAQRLEQMKAGGDRPGGRGPGEGGGPPGGRGEGPGASGVPPFMVERIKNASPEDLEQIKERMKQFGMTSERIDEVVKNIRGENGNDS